MAHSASGCNLPHGAGKAITAARHGLDVRVAVRLVAERLAQRVHVLGEIGLLDEGVWPERLHQLGLGDDPLAVAGEEDQQVERLRREWDRLAAALHTAQSDIDLVRPELVDPVHDGS